MKIGKFDVPDMRLHPTLISDIKTMYSKFGQKSIDYTTLASVLGHKSARSGTFTAKMTVMRTYNLIEGRGKVCVTETGKKIAQIPPNSQELNAGLTEAVTSIPLWKELYEKYTEVGEDLPSSDFWLVLREICQISPEEAQNKAEMVRKAYLEDIKDVESPEGGDSDMENEEKRSTARAPQQGIQQSVYEALSFRNGGIELRLPKEGLKEKWQKYKKMIDIYLEAETD